MIASAGRFVPSLLRQDGADVILWTCGDDHSSRWVRILRDCGGIHKGKACCQIQSRDTDMRRQCFSLRAAGWVLEYHAFTLFWPVP